MHRGVRPCARAAKTGDQTLAARHAQLAREARKEGLGVVRAPERERLDVDVGGRKLPVVHDSYTHLTLQTKA